MHLKLIESHFGTKIFLVQTERGKYIVKSLPLSVKGMENEGCVTEYLRAHSIPVAQIYKTERTEKFQYNVQEFIEGETPQVNTAPDWLLEQCADLLGRIHLILAGYGPMEINFGRDFFRKKNAKDALRRYVKQPGKSPEVEERIKHLERISRFDIDTRRLTYINSHGDFHIGQVIEKDGALTVIDWTSACKLPACLEIMTSYVSADPACANGEINAARLKRYITGYTKHARLNAYDLRMMPYVYYFQQIMCHYPPPYDNVAESYQPICVLINRATHWLYSHIEELSTQLCDFEEEHNG